MDKKVLVNFLKIRLSALLVKRVIVHFRESQKLLGRVCLFCLFQKQKVLLEKAKQANSPEELLALAKVNGYPLDKEGAKACFP